ncbi:usherin-like, partial [Scleropages formosus]
CIDFHPPSPKHCPRCKTCNCDPAGSVSASCHPGSGRCQCKTFVEGDKCDTCTQGASYLNASNHLGCSKAPSQQPPPTGLVLNSSAIRLTWDPPDSPNTNLLEYILVRDSLDVFHIQSHYPFEVIVVLLILFLCCEFEQLELQAFEDTDLSPYTLYTYHLVTSNIHGKTSSAAVSYRTLASIPSQEELQLHVIGRVGPTSATFNWTSPQQAHGPLVGFVLTSITAEGQEEQIHYSGLGTEAAADKLTPFTRYSFTLQACTNGGCGRSAPLAITTSQAAPRMQAAPRVRTGGPTVLHVDWDPPAQPNGVIIRYELFMHGPVEPGDNGNGSAPERRVFHSTGWLSPHSTAGLANENTPVAPQSTASVSGLEPFSSYQFRVLSVNMAGSTLSDWTTGRTHEAEPQRMSPPRVSALSSSSLHVTWETPSDKDARGTVTMYRVNLQEENASNQYAPSIISTVLHRASPEERTYTVEGLQAYQVYNFTVELCNRLGCVASPSVAAQTLSAAGLSSPKLKALNMTVMEVSWEPPREPNGPPPLYQVERMDPSLSNPHSLVVRGIRFPGHSYFLFPSSTLPANTYFTGIQLSFRTKEEAGLILCAIAPGDQEEYVALQIQNGRLFFLFDPQASAVAVSPENDGGKRYDDNQWHHVIATRRHAVGTIIVDNQYQGSSSATSGNTVIGENTGIFIGGLPENFTLLRNDTGNARLVQRGFCGCLKDLLVKRSDSPTEVWEPLDWDAAQESIEAYHSWEGCPALTEEGAHFLGQGFLQLQPSVFSGGENFEISFEFKSDQLNALLLFAYDTEGDDYVLAKLQGGTLSWTLRWAGGEAQVNLWVGLSYCNGGWNSVSLLKQGALVAATMNGLSEQLPGGDSGELVVSSPLYLGGVPDRLESTVPRRFGLLQGEIRFYDSIPLYFYLLIALLSENSLLKNIFLVGFGGCVRGVRLARGPAMSLAAMFSHAVRVNLDGCLSTSTAVHCRGNDSVLVYTGNDRRIEDGRVQPFTEYLYRVLASGEGGWTSGPWARGRSREEAPQSVLIPTRVVCVNGYSAEVSWDEPVGVRGVIEKYIVKAYNRDDPSVAPISAVFLHAEQVTGSLSGLAPFTNYSITLTACTRTGCTESHDGRDITTPQEAPDEVTPPYAVSYPNSLSVYWHAPQRPNGIITQYLLYKDNDLVYTGNDMVFNITGLEVHSPHWLLLTACTSTGCSNSSQVLLFTAQMPPTHVEPPALTVLDSRSIYVQWSAPLEVNGVLEFYTLYLAAHGEEPIAVYNSSELFQDHTLRNLIPGSTYFIQIAACTGGGCTCSSPSVARTEESTPEDVSAPTITPLTPNSFNISWAPPLKPNGAITSYSLWMNGALVQNSTSQYFWVGDLSPWSLHSFRVQACTARGCALGPLVSARRVYIMLMCRRQMAAGVIKLIDLLHSIQRRLLTLDIWCKCHSGPMDARTLEAAPVGTVTLDIRNEGPRSVRAKWQGPSRPNGNLMYSLLFHGAFYKHSAHNSSVEESTRALHTSAEASRWVTIGGLVPFSNYTVWVNACNSEGCVASPPSAITLPPGAPDGVMPPRLAAATPSSLRVVWSTPARTNGPGPPLYQLKMKMVDEPHIQLLLENESTTFSYTAESLRPYTEYQFQLVVSHSRGRTASEWTSFFTAQDREFCPKQDHALKWHSRDVKFQSHTARALPISTHCESQVHRGRSAGVHGDRSIKRPGPISFLRASSIQPRSATIMWQPPSQTNGIITHYNVYQNSQLRARVPGNSTTYTFSHLEPYLEYTFEVEGCTEAGCTLSSTSQTLRTPPAPPEDIPAPQLYSDTPTSVLLSWERPQRPNGELQRYVVERRVSGSQQVSTVASLQPNQPLNYLDSSAALSPWTSYDYRVVATTLLGGSNSSAWRQVTTRPSRPAGLQPPHVQVLGPSSIQVIWNAPLISNGKIERYEIRLPEPYISLTNTSKLNYTIADLVPYTNYSVSIVACSGGNGHVGGCTESLPTQVTTLPTVPQGLGQLTVVAVSESFLAVSWPPPQRTNGPNVRYELLRRKTRQPLASEPPEDLDLWYNVYAGAKLFHEDKGLSRFTTYQYKLLVHNDVASTATEPVEATTLAGVPLAASIISAWALNHTAVQVNWSTPCKSHSTLQDLQGAVELYTLWVNSSQLNRAISFPPGINSTVIGDLQPSTQYQLTVLVFNGAHTVTSEAAIFNTSDGEPEGVLSPEVVTINSTAVRVFWTAPLVPNGVVTDYSIYLDGQRHRTGRSTPGYLELGGLLPFTVYEIKVEVCTVYACTQSNITKVTTVEDRPTHLAAPYAHVVSSQIKGGRHEVPYLLRQIKTSSHNLPSRSVQVDWSKPGQPNGILLGYNVRRRVLLPCKEGQSQAFGAGPHCSYLECSAEESVCGLSCFQPATELCVLLYLAIANSRIGTVYRIELGHQCCENHYLQPGNTSLSVCCGGLFLALLPEHQCCGGFYRPVRPGEVCCPTADGLFVSVGLGDSCCGGRPFSSSSGQICCRGEVHDGFDSQCCGGQVLSLHMVCCGDGDSGTAYTPTQGMVCCGELYVNASNTLCCGGNDGPAQDHPIGNGTAATKCCASEAIAQEEACCSGVGYNPLTHVCADRPSPGLHIEEGCQPGILCPISAANKAYCGTCDFNPAVSSCTLVSGVPRADPPPAASAAAHPTGQNNFCPSVEEVIYTGDANTYTFTDTGLKPFTRYEYRVGTWNSFGWGYSPFSSVTTKEDVPLGVSPPRWSLVGERNDVIQLDWKVPTKPNGEINRYVVLRNGQERYRGTELSFTDMGIQPFQEYEYQLRVCTAAGCTDSAKVVAATVLGVPESIPAPSIHALGPQALQLSWSAPGKPNGVIREYHLHQIGTGLIFADSTGAMQHIVTEELVASERFVNQGKDIFLKVAPGGELEHSVGRELAEASPQQARQLIPVLGGWQIVPSTPCESAYLASLPGPDPASEPVHKSAVGLQPYTSYSFLLSACTAVGCRESEPSTGRTLQDAPAGVWAQPRHLALNSSALELYWSTPLKPNGLVFRYQLLRDGMGVFSADGGMLSYVDTALQPGSRYLYQLEATTEGGSSLSGTYVIHTPASSPERIPAPYNVTVTSPRSVFVAWTRPEVFNASVPLEYNILLNPGSEQALIHTARENQSLMLENLEPFTQYEIRVQACQHGGCGVGEPVYVQTSEAPPEELDPPVVTATGPTVIEVRWRPPRKPNGLIRAYYIHRRPLGTERELLIFIWSEGPLEFTDASSSLQPFSEYEYCLKALNNEGSTYSQWASALTMEAEPEGMATPTARASGAYSVLLNWTQPELPNGVITKYRVIYQKHVSDPTLNASSAIALTMQRTILPEKDTRRGVRAVVGPWRFVPAPCGLHICLGCTRWACAICSLGNGPAGCMWTAWGRVLQEPQRRLCFQPPCTPAPPLHLSNSPKSNLAAQ